jgi:hypothetical protein
MTNVNKNDLNLLRNQMVRLLQKWLYHINRHQKVRNQLVDQQQKAYQENGFAKGTAG